MRNIFHLAMQLLFNEGIFTSEAVLTWIKAAKVEKVKEQVKKEVREDEDEESESEQEEIDEVVLGKFLKDVSCGFGNVFSSGNLRSTLEVWRKKKRRLRGNTGRRSMTLKSSDSDIKSPLIYE